MCLEVNHRCFSLVRDVQITFVLEKGLGAHKPLSVQFSAYTDFAGRSYMFC